MGTCQSSVPPGDQHLSSEDRPLSRGNRRQHTRSLTTQITIGDTPLEELAKPVTHRVPDTRAPCRRAPASEGRPCTPHPHPQHKHSGTNKYSLHCSLGSLRSSLESKKCFSSECTTGQVCPLKRKKKEKKVYIMLRFPGGLSKAYLTPEWVRGVVNHVKWPLSLECGSQDAWI